MAAAAGSAVAQAIADGQRAAPASVNLAQRGLGVLPPPVLALTHIVRLGLSGNVLADLPRGLAALKALRYLNIRGNRFAHLPEVVCELPLLEILDASRNRISRLPAAPGALVRLKVLSVSRNLLTELPLYIADMAQLKLLRLDGNPLKWPPQHVLAIAENAPQPDVDRWLVKLRKYIRENDPPESPSAAGPDFSVTSAFLQEFEEDHPDEDAQPEPVSTVKGDPIDITSFREQKTELVTQEVGNDADFAAAAGNYFDNCRARDELVVAAVNARAAQDADEGAFLVVVYDAVKVLRVALKGVVTIALATGRLFKEGGHRHQVALGSAVLEIVDAFQRVESKLAEYPSADEVGDDDDQVDRRALIKNIFDRYDTAKDRVRAAIKAARQQLAALVPIVDPRALHDVLLDWDAGMHDAQRALRLLRPALQEGSSTVAHLRDAAYLAISKKAGGVEEISLFPITEPAERIYGDAMHLVSLLKPFLEEVKNRLVHYQDCNSDEPLVFHHHMDRDGYTFAVFAHEMAIKNAGGDVSATMDALGKVGSAIKELADAGKLMVKVLMLRVIDERMGDRKPERAVLPQVDVFMECVCSFLETVNDARLHFEEAHGVKKDAFLPDVVAAAYRKLATDAQNFIRGFDQ